MNKPLRRERFSDAVDESPLVILRNNSLYLTRSLLRGIGDPTHVKLSTRNGSVVVAPATGVGKRGRRYDGVYKLVKSRRGGGWVPRGEWIIREVFGADLTLAVDYALHPVSQP